MSSQYLLELDGKPAGRVYDAKIPPRDSTDLTFFCGVGMSRGFYDWLAASVAQRATRQRGAILTVDHTLRVTSRTEFDQALVSEVSLPRLDRTTRAAGALDVSIRAPLLREQAGIAIRLLRLPFPVPWHIGDFRIAIDTMEDVSAHIQGIEAIGLSQKIVTSQPGRSRLPDHVSSGVGFSNIIITLPTRHASSFAKWLDESVKGPAAKNGAIEFLAPGGSGSYFRLDLRGLQIQSLAKTVSAALSKVVLFCNAVTFHAQTAAIGQSGHQW